jgi:hypothetical protein
MHEKLGPARTIAKESQERKENSSKKAGKTQFFWQRCGNPRKKAVSVPDREFFTTSRLLRSQSQPEGNPAIS